MGQVDEHEAEFFARTAVVQDEHIYERIKAPNLCALIAEKVMLWHPATPTQIKKMTVDTRPGTFLLDLDGACYRERNGEYPVNCLFRPDIDIAAAFMVEEKLKERDLFTSYALALLQRVTPVRGYPVALYLRLSMAQVFAVAHASPRDRSFAALEAVGIITREKMA